MTRRRHRSLLRTCAAITLAALVAGSLQASAASTASVVISATVPSATSLDVTGCASGTSNQTDFGIVQPGAKRVTSVDCDIEFGSSNDTGRLRIAQEDGDGLAMWALTTGVLDTSFSGDGVGTIAAAGADRDEANEAAVMADGRIVLAGGCAPGTDDTCIVRFQADGTADPAFGIGGVVRVDLGGWDAAEALVVHDDGRVVVTGTCSSDLCVARFLADGTADGSFGPGGVQQLDLGVGFASGMDIVIDDEDRYVVAVSCMGAGWCPVRYNSNGTLDTTFDGNGIIEPIGPNSYLQDILLQPDGKLVIGGDCDAGSASNIDFCYWRLEEDGSFNSSFGVGGRAEVVIPPSGGYDYIMDIALKPDGRIIGAGTCAIAQEEFCVSVVNPDGSIDTTFGGGDGVVIVDLGDNGGYDEIQGLLSNPDGTITIGGGCETSGGMDWQMCIARLDSNGNYDPTFDDDGEVLGPTLSHAGDLVAGADGRLIAAGFCTPGATAEDMCAVVYDNAGEVQQYDDGVSDWDDTVGTSLFAACLHTITGGTATWTTSATCPANDGAYWNEVPESPVQIASADPNEPAALAQLRFGMRTAPNQTPGSYLAPITFDVIAP